MRRLTFALVLVVVAGLMAGGLVACSGGKGGGKVLRGVANVNSATQNGRVGTCYLQDPNDPDSEMLTDTSGSIARSPSGWQDEAWACGWPGRSVSLWSFIAFNDYNHNNRFDESAEILGFGDRFLAHLSDGRWVLVDSNANIVSTSPEKASIYIDCQFSSRGRVDQVSLRAQLQTLAVRLR